MNNQLKSLSLSLLLFQTLAIANPLYLSTEDLSSVYGAISSDDTELLDQQLAKLEITDINKFPLSERYGTPLVYAARAGKVKMVKHLVEKYNAGLNIPGQYGDTALLAIADGTKAEHVEITDYLIGKKASLNGVGYRCNWKEGNRYNFNFIQKYEILKSNFQLAPVYAFLPDFVRSGLFRLIKNKRIIPHKPAPYFEAKRWHEFEKIHPNGRRYIHAGTIRQKLKDAYLKQTPYLARLANKFYRTVRCEAFRGQMH